MLMYINHMFTCKICNNQNNNKIYHVKEMMFGMRDNFEYVECGNCGCLQIKDIPNNLSKYYPDNYYSFDESEPEIKSYFLEKFIRHQRALYVLQGKGFIGKLINNKKPAKSIYKWLKKVDVNFDSNILDIGSGKGALVRSLYKDGFKNILGIDPFIDKDVYLFNKKIVVKKDISEVTDKYDFVMLHHALEHMPEQHKVFSDIYNLLNKGGYVLIRIPTISSYTWRKFRENWSNLDAPRHLYLHSLKSIEMLAKKYNFITKDISFDSNNFGFWASIQYSKDIPLYDKKKLFN